MHVHSTELTPSCCCVTLRQGGKNVLQPLSGFQTSLDICLHIYIHAQS